MNVEYRTTLNQNKHTFRLMFMYNILIDLRSIAQNLKLLKLVQKLYIFLKLL